MYVCTWKMHFFHGCLNMVFKDVGERKSLTLKSLSNRHRPTKENLLKEFKSLMSFGLSQSTHGVHCLKNRILNYWEKQILRGKFIRWHSGCNVDQKVEFKTLILREIYSFTIVNQWNCAVAVLVTFLITLLCCFSWSSFGFHLSDEVVIAYGGSRFNFLCTTWPQLLCWNQVYERRTDNQAVNSFRTISSL